MVNPNLVDTYIVGKEGFIVGLCEALGLPETFNQALGSVNGRPTDIPYGVVAMIIMVNMCHDHRPLSRLKDYYEYSDLEELFHYPVQMEQLNDDRFGGFLDLFFEAGCRKLFTQVAAKAVSLYGIKVNNINFDTTSKVMWGQYETAEETLGVVKMDFGHSKDKRDDKKQIKFGSGCANGLVVDARVLSGNMDDKTYNKETLKELDSTLKNLNVNKDSFYYIADSALFSEENLTIATGSSINLITRMPDNVLVAKSSIEEAVGQLDSLKTITVENSKENGSGYRIMEKTCEYAGHNLSLAVCYSESLRPTKEQTIRKAAAKEADAISCVIKTLSKREFACEEDSNLEVAKLKDKTLKKPFSMMLSILFAQKSGVGEDGRQKLKPDLRLRSTNTLLMSHLLPMSRRLQIQSIRLPVLFSVQMTQNSVGKPCFVNTRHRILLKRSSNSLNHLSSLTLSIWSHPS